MARADLNLLDLTRDLSEVAHGLPEWQRGDADEAAAETLAISAGSLFERRYTLWAWTGTTADGEPAWALPVPATASAAFAPRGPARVLALSIAAARLADARLDDLSIAEWHGFTLLVAPGLDPRVATEALTLAHPEASRVAVGALPTPFEDTADIALSDPPSGQPPRSGWDLVDLARATRVHPLQVAIALASHGQDLTTGSFDPEIVAALRVWGCDGPPEAPPPPSFAIEDDPCQRRRHARRALHRLLGMKKIGALYHTEIDHFARGAPPDLRGDALAIGEALVKAEILGAKQSVGQQHVYLRREALPAIHALIDRGESADPRVAALWTAPPPGAQGA